MSQLFAGTSSMLRVQTRTGRWVILGWVVGLCALLGLSGASLQQLYDTPAELATYAASVSGGAMYMLNGRVAGIGTLGGVFANEFGFVIGFFVPLMALALVARSTRRDEELGRLELLLASRTGRQAPLVAAVLVSLAALGLLALGIFSFMVGFSLSVPGAAYFSLAVFALGAVHTGVAAILAQVFEHNRGVWGAGLAVIVATFLLRGVGAVQDSAIIWASPLGWYDEVRAFGDPQPIALVLSLGTAAGLIAFSVWLATRRDVGAALLRSRPAAARASTWLRSPIGLAWYEHRGPILGWSILAVVLMGAYGALIEQVVAAVTNNPDLGDFFGGSPDSGAIVKQIESMFVMMMTMLSAAFVVQAVGSLRKEEDAGRLEGQLVEGRSRWAWLDTHIVVVALGAVTIQVMGTVTLGLLTSTSLGEPGWTGTLLQAGLTQLPVLLFFAGLGFALFGWWPAGQSLAWAAFGLGVVVAYMGPGMNLAEAVIDASPFVAIGQVPAEDASAVGAAALVGLGVAGLVGGLVGFRQRDVPRT